MTNRKCWAYWAVDNSVRYSCPAWYANNGLYKYIITANNEYVYKREFLQSVVAGSYLHLGVLYVLFVAQCHV